MANEERLEVHEAILDLRAFNKMKYSVNRLERLFGIPKQNIFNRVIKREKIIRKKVQDIKNKKRKR